MGYFTDKEQKEIIAKNLTYFIKLSGKDQKQIAIDLDINPPTFNQWVNGKAIPSVSTLKRLALYFGTTLTRIVNPEEEADKDSMELSKKEKALIEYYRYADDYERALVDRLMAYQNALGKEVKNGERKEAPERSMENIRSETDQRKNS